MDVNDFAVNDYFAPEEIRVPFRNIVYIGDSDTDIPCMKLVNTYGGHSIGVYNVEKTKVYKMMRDGRIKYYVPADYTDGSELDGLVKAIIDRTATNEILEAKHYMCIKENLDADKASNEEKKKKTDLIIALENSGSFARTHMVIGELQQYANWTSDEKEDLFEIAIKNSQVFYILGDVDVKSFYKNLLKESAVLSENAQTVKDAIENDK